MNKINKIKKFFIELDIVLLVILSVVILISTAFNKTIVQGGKNESFF